MLWLLFLEGLEPPHKNLLKFHIIHHVTTVSQKLKLEWNLETHSLANSFSLARLGIIKLISCWTPGDGARIATSTKWNEDILICINSACFQLSAIMRCARRENYRVSCTKRQKRTLSAHRKENNLTRVGNGLTLANPNGKYLCLSAECREPWSEGLSPSFTRI